VRTSLTLSPLQSDSRASAGLQRAADSFPGFLVLTDDMPKSSTTTMPVWKARTSFRFAGRVPKAEVRGCGNLETTRHNRAG